MIRYSIICRQGIKCSNLPDTWQKNIKKSENPHKKIRESPCIGDSFVLFYASVFLHAIESINHMCGLREGA